MIKELKVGIVKSTLHEILKQPKFNLFKIRLLQELNEDNPDQIVKICKTIEHLTDAQPNYLS